MMRRPPHRLLAVTVAGLALLGAACGGGDDDGGEPPAAGHVRVIDNEFEPKELSVAVGDTVTWDFEGAVQHNVTGSGFKSENQKDGSFEHTFNSAGDYEYTCTLHPGMNGKVVVE